MKALVYTAPNEVVYRDAPPPSRAEGEPRPEGGGGARFRGGRRADDRMAVRSKETNG